MTLRAPVVLNGSAFHNSRLRHAFCFSMVAVSQLASTTSSRQPGGRLVNLGHDHIRHHPHPLRGAKIFRVWMRADREKTLAICFGCRLEWHDDARCCNILRLFVFRNGYWETWINMRTSLPAKSGSVKFPLGLDRILLITKIVIRNNK